MITMACKVSEIVAVIDMDGYQIQNKFLFKEMGLLKVGDTEAKSFFFDINLQWGDLTHKDRKTCSYVQNRIHKLPLGVPLGIKAFQISELEAIVENFYIETKFDLFLKNIQHYDCSLNCSISFFSKCS